MYGSDNSIKLLPHSFGFETYQNYSFVLFPVECSVIMSTDHEKRIQGLKELQRIRVGYHNEKVKYPVPVIASKDGEWLHPRPTTNQTTTVLSEPSNHKKDDDEFCNNRQLQHSRKSVQKTTSTRLNHRQLPSYRHSSFSQYHIPSLTATQFRSTPDTTTLSLHHNNSSFDERFPCLFPPPNRNVSEINQFDKSLQVSPNQKLSMCLRRKISKNNHRSPPPSPTNSTSSSSSISYSPTRQRTQIAQATTDCLNVSHSPITTYNRLSLSASSISSCSRNEIGKKSLTLPISSFPLPNEQLRTAENEYNNDDALSDSSFNRILTSTTTINSEQPMAQRLSRKIFAKLFPSFSVSKS
ncbi:unnamed protein product [Didymodactylos carnosus]|uniref:Uncharacterized protein n=1 Tax=Didymodactylos carnosus TaxID=1234261 RepID=A0A813X7X9_9BILA|nr:unnamed protein product [Didymodactylos carnosus]CAF0866636.1 unnamed protein product [Didymodactylos carnosus]CAF3637895.1 unnamed protein product [Didymodactylos carnosus]CAF3654117.1 unnamed protein product [Didymodactylos carnosus]